MEASVLSNEASARFVTDLLHEVDLTISRFSEENFQERDDTKPTLRYDYRVVGGIWRGNLYPGTGESSTLPGGVGTPNRKPAQRGHLSPGIPRERPNRRGEAGNQESAPALARQCGPGPGMALLRMKRTPAEFMAEFAAQTRPLDHHISPKSVARFQDDDRLWPVEVWMRIPTHDGNEIPQVWEMYVDPCNPEPGAVYLEREWRIRKLTLTELGRVPPKECPERIVAGCTPDDDESKFILACWMASNETD